MRRNGTILVSLALLAISILLVGPLPFEGREAVNAAPRPAREQTHPAIAWNASKEGKRYLVPG